MSDTNDKKIDMNLPNKLTILRTILIPFFLVLIGAAFVSFLKVPLYSLSNTYSKFLIGIS